MVMMTLAAFELKWGKRGLFNGGNWWIGHDGTVRIDIFSAAHYVHADSSLTALGCKPPDPPDPRDAVFKAYGWSNCELGWMYSYQPGNSITVRKCDGDINSMLYNVTTAAQAEALCILMGLSKVPS